MPSQLWDVCLLQACSPSSLYEPAKENLTASGLFSRSYTSESSWGQSSSHLFSPFVMADFTWVSEYSLHFINRSPNIGICLSTVSPLLLVLSYSPALWYRSVISHQERLPPPLIPKVQLIMKPTNLVAICLTHWISDEKLYPQRSALQFCQRGAHITVCIWGGVLDIEPRASFMLVQHATTELHSTAACTVTELHFSCMYSTLLFRPFRNTNWLLHN